MSALFDYPKLAKFGRIVAKDKIYDRVKSSRKTQEAFVSQVNRIIWQYKLAPKTTNLTETAKVKEIEIFEIPLKKNDLDSNILLNIDRAIAHPIIFHLTFEDKIKVAATYKRPSDGDHSKWVLGDDYFETDWLPSDTERQKLPVVLDLSSLYEHILRQILPLTMRENESLECHIDRVALLSYKSKEHKKLETRMSNEKQFNRKVEMNAKLRNLGNEIEQLKQNEKA